MPNPAQIRELRVLHLVAVARILINRGRSPYNLAGSLIAQASRAWPGVRESTIKSYVSSAISEVLSRPNTDFDILTETVSPQEEA